MPERPEERLFFVVGRGRSGTTLLSRLLDRHPTVCVAPEALFVASLWRRYRACRWDATAVDRFLHDLRREERTTRWRLDAEALRERLLAVVRGGEASFPRLCAEVYAEHARGCGKPANSLLGDQNPHHALFAGELGELFPAARFVHLVRDPRDNVLSFRRVPWDLSSHAGLAERWHEHNRRLLAAAPRLAGRYHRLTFEELVQRPAETVAAVVAFLGLDPPPGADLSAADAPEAALAWHVRLRSPVDAARAGTWRGEMSAARVRLVDHVTGDIAARLGYRLDAEAASRGRRLATAVRALPGRLLGRAFTRLELLLFRLPFALRWRSLRAYRRLTGNRIA